jgi:hypothetical protein
MQHSNRIGVYSTALTQHPIASVGTRRLHQNTLSSSSGTVPAQRPGVQRRRPLDRESGRAETKFQKRPDLARRAAASAATPCWARAQ